jgi:hypothetical protein
MCIIITGSGRPKGLTGPWFSGYIKPKKKYFCNFCGRVRGKSTPYKWVDGGRSCQKCNNDDNEADKKKLKQLGYDV